VGKKAKSYGGMKKIRKCNAPMANNKNTAGITEQTKKRRSPMYVFFTLHKQGGGGGK